MKLNTSCVLIFHHLHFLLHRFRRRRLCHWLSSAGGQVARAWAPSTLGSNRHRTVTTVFAPSSVAVMVPGRIWSWPGSKALWTLHSRLYCLWRTSPRNRFPNPPPPDTTSLRTEPDNKLDTTFSKLDGTCRYIIDIKQSYHNNSYE